MDIFSPSVLSAISRFSGFNGAPVVVGVGATSILSVSLGLVTRGQILWVVTECNMPKGITAGESQIVVQNSGGAILDWGVASISVNWNNPSVPASTFWRDVRTLMARVTFAGNCNIDMFGLSAGSDSTVPINGATFFVFKVDR